MRLQPGVNEVSSLFLIGGPFQLSLSLAADTMAGALPPTPRSSSLDVTLQWHGISRVQVADTLVPYTLTSASGTNWALAAPIPEPPVTPLLALEVAVLGLRAGRAES